jgi:hypothetical protein
MLGAFVVILDMLGAAGRAGAGNVAYSVHLAGAAFALIYFQQRWNFTRLTDRATGWLRSLRRPKFRIHRPPETPNGLNEEVDRILEKIHREGEASLTAKERRTLETASREYRQQGAAGNERENP